MYVFVQDWEADALLIIGICDVLERFTINYQL